MIKGKNPIHDNIYQIPSIEKIMENIEEKSKNGEYGNGGSLVVWEMNQEEKELYERMYPPSRQVQFPPRPLSFCKSKGTKAII